MNSRNVETNRILDRFLEELGQPLSSDHTRRASNRVLENLAGMDTFAEQSLPVLPVQSTRAIRWWTPITAVAAALFAVAALVGMLSLPGGAQPIATRLNKNPMTAVNASSIAEGQHVQSDGSGGNVLALQDGSRVEMAAGAQLSINRAPDGIRVDLAEGNIIVTAAKQHDGHLYVKTRDCMVSVAGTVFSVKAEAAGSRVAVIEGEVHVQHGGVSQTLLTGQQVATNIEMKAVPLETAIEWSQNPGVYIAMLQQTAPPAAPSRTADPVQNSIPPRIGRYYGAFFPQRGQGGRGDAITPYFRRGEYYGAVNIQEYPLSPDQIRDTGFFYRVERTYSTKSFSFSITGIQERTISFRGGKGEIFSYGCTDCAFVVSESGVSKAAAVSEPGVEFRLTTDGTALTATCHLAQCSLGQRVVRLDSTSTPFAGYSFALRGSNFQENSASGQSVTIPTTQLALPAGEGLVFVVSK